MFNQWQRVATLALLLTSCDPGSDTTSKDVVYSIPTKIFKLAYKEINGEKQGISSKIEKKLHNDKVTNRDRKTIKDLLREINIALKQPAIKESKISSDKIVQQEKIIYTTIEKKIVIPAHEIKLIEPKTWSNDGIKHETQVDNIIINELDITVAPITANYISQTSWSKLKINLPVEQKTEIKKSEIAYEKYNVDTVKTISAAAEKINLEATLSGQTVKISENSLIKENKDNNVSEDLVLYDYSNTTNKNNEINDNEKIAKTTHPESFKKEIEIYNQPENKKSLKETQNIISVNEISLTRDLIAKAASKAPAFKVVSTHKKKKNKYPIKKESKNNEYSTESLVADTNENNDTMDTQVIIKATATDLDGGLHDIKTFELEYLDNQNLVLQSHNGSINILERLVREQNIRTVKLISRGMVPVFTDIVRDGAKVLYQVPMILEEVYNQFMAKRNVDSYSGTLLVAMGDSIEDVEIDGDTKNYQEKLYLNKNLKIVSPSDNDYSFTMFIGVRTGNQILYVKNYKQETSSKIIYVHPDVLSYEVQDDLKHVNDRISLLTEDTLSKLTPPLEISSNEISPFSYNGQFEKLSINTLENKMGIYPLGTRRYFELKYLNEPIYVGIGTNESATLPTESYIQAVIGQMNGTTKESCIVQINLKKQIKEITVNTLSSYGYENSVIKFLDEDGKFYESVGPLTKKVIIKAENQGIVYLGIQYKDSSSQYIQSFCSSGSYLVESL